MPNTVKTACGTCEKSSNCLMKKSGQTNSKVEEKINDLVFFASCLQPDVPDDDKLDALEMLLRQTVDYNILQSKEASKVGTLTRTLRTLPGEVGSMASKVLEKWRCLGWGGWSDFLPDSSEVEPYPMSTDEVYVPAEEDTEQSETFGQIQNADSSEDGVMEVDSVEPTCSEQGTTYLKGIQNSSKGCRKNLREQKLESERNFETLISKVENDIKPYKCMCGATFETRAETSRHANLCGKRRVVTKKKKRKMKKKCNSCGALFVNSNEINIHKKTEHPNIEDSFKCRFANCSSILTSTKNYRQHLRTHKKHEGYKCPCCSKRFHQMGSRNRHVFNNHKKDLDFHALEDPSMSTDLELIRREETGVVFQPKVKRELVSRIIKSLISKTGGNSRVINEDEVPKNNESDVEDDDNDVEDDDHDVEDDDHDVEDDENGAENEIKDDFYIQLRKAQIQEKMEKLRNLGIIDFKKEEKEEKLRNKRKNSRPKQSNYPQLPTRKSRRIRGLNEGVEDVEELMVLAPDLDDYLSTVEPIPVTTLKELPKSVRSKPMPSIRIPSKDSNPPLPIRFYSCVPLPHLEDSNPKSPIEILENEDKNLNDDTDRSLFLPVMPCGSLVGIGSKFDLQSPVDAHRSILDIHPKLQISESSKAAKRPLQGGRRKVIFFKASYLSPEGIKTEQNDDEISSEFSDVEGRFPCDVCPFNTANDNKDLRRHKNAMHKQLPKPVVCLKFWCQQEFYTKYELKNHQKTCKELHCPEDGCNFIFKWKHQLEPHKRLHASNK